MLGRGESMNFLEPWTWLRDLLGWLWVRTTNDRLKTLAACIQALRFVAAAFLTYRYGRKLEHHKFDMRLKEITHANTHKRRMESMEKISGQMGKVLANLALVPPFVDYYGLDPLPSPEMEGANPEDREERRSRFRLKQYYQAKLNLMEAAEEGYIYVDDVNHSLIEAFLSDTDDLLKKFDDERDTNRPMSRFEAMDNFKERYKKVRDARRNIVIEFKKQLQG